MIYLQRILLLATSLTAVVLFCGCGQKRIESTEAPKPAGDSSVGQRAVLQKDYRSVSGHYLVEKHDCLWTIAGQPRVYGDSFQWPELYKLNRDKIKDPDLIYPRQDLMVQKGLSQEEISRVKRLAMDTPKYVPHTQPRQTLPVDYF